jgi:ubiquinone/menaquinone biosynthesis C-methylase UbiE
MKIRPDDSILEIGCGHGVAATLVCRKLNGGHLTAVDRSRKMIEAAASRNTEYMAAGTAEFIVANFEELDLRARRFDKILAVRVSLFHREPKRSRSIVERWLAPGGQLFIFFDAPAAVAPLRPKSGVIKSSVLRNPVSVSGLRRENPPQKTELALLVRKDLQDRSAPEFEDALKLHAHKGQS